MKKINEMLSSMLFFVYAKGGLCNFKFWYLITFHLFIMCFCTILSKSAENT